LNDKIRGFEQKLLLWRNQLTANNVSHFKHLAKENALTAGKYVKYIDMLIEEFDMRFKMFKNEKTACFLKMFSSPFNIDVNLIPEMFQMEVINIQSNSDLKNVFFSVGIHDFYRLYVNSESFPLLIQNAKQMMSLFGSTYVCEQIFSSMNIIKNDFRSRIGDVRLESCIRVATSSIDVDMDALVSKKQFQSSHK
jgi:hypothetical protein